LAGGRPRSMIPREGTTEVRSMRTALPYLALTAALLLATGCDPEDVEKTRAKAKAVATQAAESAKDVADDVKPVVDKAAAVATQAIDATKPALEKARTTATQAAGAVAAAAKTAAREVKNAATQAAEKVRP
jgi:hypothetical protein